MEFYCLVEHITVYECYEDEVFVSHFATKEEALKAYNKTVEKEKEWLKENELGKYDIHNEEVEGDNHTFYLHIEDVHTVRVHLTKEVL